MPPKARYFVVGVVLTVLAVSISCWRSSEDPAPVDPATVLSKFLEAHYEGLGHMERFEYSDAVASFREAARLRPDDLTPKINLAIALLNDTGLKSEALKAQGGEVTESNFDEALRILDGVLAEEPSNLHAHFCRGIILQYVSENAQAHEEFKYVVEHDASDAKAWELYGTTLPSLKNPDFPAELDRAEELVEIYSKALECNPYLVPALYKLYGAYKFAEMTRDDPKAKAEAAARRDARFAEFRRIDPDKNPSGSGDPGETTYGQMGKYATVIDPFSNPRTRASDLIAPRFAGATRLEIDLPAGDRWAQAGDFTGPPESPLAIVGRARDRFGASVATFDADRDGLLDILMLSAIRTEGGVRDALFLNQGGGKFADASDDFGLPDDHPSLGVASGDFDADGWIDLVFTGVGGARLLRNVEGKHFEILDDALAGQGESVSPTARWLDLDQDGDLDLIVVNYAPIADAATVFDPDAPPGVGLANSVYRNDGVPPSIPNTLPNNHAPSAVIGDDRPKLGGLSIALTAWEGPEVEALLDGDRRHTGLAALDLDDDRDLDLVLTADGGPPSAAINDRLGRFTARELSDLNRDGGPINGVVALNLDHDARSDLVLVDPSGRLSALQNTEPPVPDTSARPPDFALQDWATNARTWRQAVAADLDLDGWRDLVGVAVEGGSESEPRAPLWARNEGSRLETTPLPIAPNSEAELLGVAVADLEGDPLPDLLLVRDGEAPSLARNLGNGRHWLALDLSGRWRFGFDFMRTNPHGLGTRLALQGEGLEVPFEVTGAESGLGQSVGPIVLGMGDAPKADLLSLRWPDGVMQAELNVPGDQAIDLKEHNRKTGSCPVLFTFNGSTYECIGDFLGGGGLGYLVAPGVYGQPDRDESVLIGPSQLLEVDGRYRIAITEPMDELAYLDRLRLEVVDLPPGMEGAPEERFAPGGNRPSGELVAWSETIELVAATDLAGRDLAGVLRHFDRETADGFNRLRGWIGYAEAHEIVLDFGDRLAGLSASDRVFLVLGGWVEYPYSQTNYAASTAGVTLEPPVLERRKPDGTWEVLEADPGYPAGMPRLTLLELTGTLGDGRCVLRLRTNMECYYDRAFLAVVGPDDGRAAVVSELAPTSAILGYRGYTREFSPDGRLPLLYDYEHVDPAPLERLEGRLTRYGDVLPLLLDDDDRLCLVNAGDEVKVEFDASGLPTLPEGWTRRFVLKSVGYCKDADPFTATSDTVGPLPWKGMPPYPFGPEGERPRDPAYDAYLDAYQTREFRR